MNKKSKLKNRIRMVSNYYFPKSRGFSFPQEIVIELTNHCNLACKMCPQKTMKRKKGFMNEALFKKIIDEVKEKTELVYLHGTGESLLHKKLPEMTRYAHSNGLITCLSTNGTIMNESLSEKLLTCGLDYLIIALDGGVKKTYENIRIKGDFNRLVSNIKTLLNHKANIDTKTNICLQMIYMPENANEIQLFKNIFSKDEEKLIDQYRFKPLYKTYTLSQKRIHHTKPCYWLWNMMSIYWNGDVPLCCMDSDLAYNFGNVGQTDAMDIWHCNELMNLRERHRKLRYNDMALCGTCDIPEQGYFNSCTILGSLFLNAAQIRDLIPIYEKYVILPRR